MDGWMDGCRKRWRGIGSRTKRRQRPKCCRLRLCCDQTLRVRCTAFFGMRKRLDSDVWMCCVRVTVTVPRCSAPLIDPTAYPSSKKKVDWQGIETQVKKVIQRHLPPFVSAEFGLTWACVTGRGGGEAGG
jgi:hypothetical protein